jgi:hypothetical protein
VSAVTLPRGSPKIVHGAAGGIDPFINGGKLVEELPGRPARDLAHEWSQRANAFFDRESSIDQPSV